MNQPQNLKGIPRCLAWMNDKFIHMQRLSLAKKLYGKRRFAAPYLYGTIVQINACPKLQIMDKEL